MRRSCVDAPEGEDGPGDHRPPAPVAEVLGHVLGGFATGQRGDVLGAGGAAADAWHASRTLEGVQVGSAEPRPDGDALVEAGRLGSHVVGTTGRTVDALVDGFLEVGDDRIVRHRLRCHQHGEEGQLDSDEDDQDLDDGASETSVVVRTTPVDGPQRCGSQVRRDRRDATGGGVGSAPGRATRRAATSAPPIARRDGVIRTGARQRLLGTARRRRDGQLTSKRTSADDVVAAGLRRGESSEVPVGGAEPR